MQRSLTRTAKPIKLYKPRDPAKKPAYRGIYPWSITDHWK